MKVIVVPFSLLNEGGKSKHKKTEYKSLDCSIMELADDISYGIHDLEDAISLSLVKEAQWNNEVVHFIKDPLIPYHLAASK